MVLNTNQKKDLEISKQSILQYCRKIQNVAIFRTFQGNIVGGNPDIRQFWTLCDSAGEWEDWGVGGLGSVRTGEWKDWGVGGLQSCKNLGSVVALLQGNFEKKTMTLRQILRENAQF